MLPPWTLRHHWYNIRRQTVVGQYKHLDEEPESPYRLEALKKLGYREKRSELRSFHPSKLFPWYTRDVSLYP
jgi:hypothetical protein